MDKSKFYINEFFGPLPLGVRYKILEFVIDDIGSLVYVSRSWNSSIKKLIQFKTAKLEMPFMNQYKEYLKWDCSCITLTKIASKGAAKVVYAPRYRLDKIFQAEVLKSLEGKTVTLSYKYSLNKKKGKLYWANYKFDVIAKGKRVTWIYQEQRKNSGNILSLIRQPVIVVCTNDLVSIYVNIWSPEGLID